MPSSPPRMWRRTYLMLVFIRLYFALSQSYLHPDEHFQGPEIVAGHVFSYPVHETWEFTSKSPIRSVFPLWIVYGLPMLILRSLWEGFGHSIVKPVVVFGTLRLLMFTLSFVLQDWAFHELVENREQRRLAILLVASSYVTWTWQVHTFSNAIETLVVTWSLVLMKRVAHVKAHRSGALASAILAFLLVFGTFNRITFPAFIMIPALRILPSIYTRPWVWGTLMVVGALTTLFAIALDTAFYRQGDETFFELVLSPVFTPLNNLLYNAQSSNLALHGTHPFYQHFLINLPVLLGPAFPLVVFSSRKNMSMVAALSGTFILSWFPHQEGRFLLPSVPLLLSSVNLPNRLTRQWIAAWIIFNLTLGVLMGVYHQGGIIKAQFYLAEQADVKQAFWWKTYSPPIWLLNGRSADLETVDLMGMDAALIEERLCASVTTTNNLGRSVLVAPRSAIFLDRFSVLKDTEPSSTLGLREAWRTGRHLNFDDMDFGDDGMWSTLQRVVGRRGLAVWDIDCPETSHKSAGKTS